MKALAERDKERVTLDNVFQLAKGAQGKRRLDAESDTKEENDRDSYEMEEQGESESEDMEESEEDDEPLDENVPRQQETEFIKSASKDFDGPS